MTTLQTVSASASPEVPMNENFATLSAAAIYGKRQPATTGLTWAYYGGLYNGNTIANGTVTLTNATDNYVVVKRSTGVVSTSTATTNWNDDQYARLYKLTTAGSVVTVEEDHRWNTNGLFLQGVGRTAIYVPACDIFPSATGGCAAHAVVATSANQPDLQTLDFDPTTQEYAQFSLNMPKRWNEGTVTFVPVWSHPATVTNFGAVWDLQGLAISNDDAIAQNFGTAQKSSDTGGTTNDLYMGPESSAITIAGTPAAEDQVFFRISRVTGDAADNLAVDARLHGITLYITIDGPTDL